MSWRINTVGMPQTPSAEFPIGKFGERCLPSSLLLITYVRLLSVKNADARSFYEKGALRCGWSVRQLGGKLRPNFMSEHYCHDKSAMLQQHAPAEMHILPQQAIRDPLIARISGIEDEYSESDFEEAINH